MKIFTCSNGRWLQENNCAFIGCTKEYAGSCDEEIEVLEDDWDIKVVSDIEIYCQPKNKLTPPQG